MKWEMAKPPITSASAFITKIVLGKIQSSHFPTANLSYNHTNVSRDEVSQFVHGSSVEGIDYETHLTLPREVNLKEVRTTVIQNTSGELDDEISGSPTGSRMPKKKTAIQS